MNQQRIALVTGGSRGIGRAIADRLAAEGRTVWITARDPGVVEAAVTEMRSAGGSVFGYPADVRSRKSVEDLLWKVRDSGGVVDLLVNNAGVANGGVPFRDDDPDRWWETLEVNVKGPMLLTRAVLPGMIERDSGIVINVSSLAAVHTIGNASAYAVSKAALTRMTNSLSFELEDTSVAIFAISPGLVLTDMTRDAPGIKDIPKDQWSTPEQAAGLCSRLASGEYMSLSGRFIHVSDNLDEMAQAAQRIREEDLYVLRLPGLEAS